MSLRVHGTATSAADVSMKQSTGFDTLACLALVCGCCSTRLCSCLNKGTFHAGLAFSVGDDQCSRWRGCSLACFSIFCSF